ncbi:MAG: hypothetical protein IH814_01665 [Thaumarchaeota archaeon]|nr:hypothetical protein [Nitrososphaerota archaeon]
METRTIISAIVAWIIASFSIYVGITDSNWIQFSIGIGFLGAGIYLLRKFYKDKKKS